MARNRTERDHLMCKAAFGHGCPKITPDAPAAAPASSSGGLLYFSTFGRLTNCVMVLELARWLAEQLGKTLVMPFCSSAENTEQACTEGSKLKDHKEDNLLIDVTAVYDRTSVGGCRTRRPALSVRDELSSHTCRRTPSASCPTRLTRKLSCVGKKTSSCAYMLASNYQFVGLSLSGFVDFDLGRLSKAWLEYATSTRGAPSGALGASALREALRRQDAGEPCTPHAFSSGCSGPNASSTDRTRARRDRATQRQPPPQPSDDAAAPLPPCLRNCRGLSVFEATGGDVFVPNLFDYGSPTDVRRHELCAPLELSARAAAQAQALRDSLPADFVCLHWRAGDFLSPDPLSRLGGSSLAHQNHALANATFMARLAARAARAVGTAHVLVLTNARWERTREFERALAADARGGAAGAVGATVLSCTDAPPDSEKHVCARGARALLLSQRSSFSVHIHRMAAARGVPVEYVSGCPSRRASLWQTSPLLKGEPIDCR